MAHLIICHNRSIIHIDSLSNRKIHNSNDIFNNISKFIDLEFADKVGKALSATSQMRLVTPKIQQQKGNINCGLIALTMMVNMIMERNKPITLRDLDNKMVTYITNNSRFKYETQDIDVFRGQLLSCFNALGDEYNLFSKNKSPREVVTIDDISSDEHADENRIATIDNATENGVEAPKSQDLAFHYPLKTHTLYGMTYVLNAITNRCGTLFSLPKLGFSLPSNITTDMMYSPLRINALGDGEGGICDIKQSDIDNLRSNETQIEESVVDLVRLM